MYVYSKNEIGNNNVKIGSGFLGHLNVNYSELEKELGSPSLGASPDDKTLCEWVIKFSDGIIATIYNYKDGINYDSENGLTKENISHWHVGGFTYEAMERVKTLFPQN